MELFIGRINARANMGVFGGDERMNTYFSYEIFTGHLCGYFINLTLYMFIYTSVYQ